MNDPQVSIVMRSYNEGWALQGTLAALRQQNWTNWELIVIDSGSTDNSVEMIRAFKPAHFVEITPREYVPGRVMNQGMRLARNPHVIFLNADATPCDDNWLRPLAEGLMRPNVAAVFGRQVPRPDCHPVFAYDYERCFGPGRESAAWDHFFSMVSSGLNKEVWARRGFLENLQYAEDDEYTRWCKAQGHHVVYCPESVVMHSHNYTPDQAFRRSFGDALAQAAAGSLRPADHDFIRTVALGWARDTARDARFCLQNHHLKELPHAMRIRWKQRTGRLAGLRQGWQKQKGAK